MFLMSAFPWCYWSRGRKAKVCGRAMKDRICNNSGLQHVDCSIDLAACGAGIRRRLVRGGCQTLSAFAFTIWQAVVEPRGESKSTARCAQTRFGADGRSAETAAFILPATSRLCTARYRANSWCTIHRKEDVRKLQRPDPRSDLGTEEFRPLPGREVSAFVESIAINELRAGPFHTIQARAVRIGSEPRAAGVFERR